MVPCVYLSTSFARPAHSHGAYTSGLCQGRLPPMLGVSQAGLPSTTLALLR